MRKQILSVVTTLFVVVALAVVSFAGLGGSVTADIPFDFTVGAKRLPAGTYTINGTANQSLLIMRSKENARAQKNETREL